MKTSTTTQEVQPKALVSLVLLACLVGAATQIWPGAGLAADRIVGTEDYRVRIVPVASGLDTPWGMTFLDRDRILVTEKPGRLRVVEGGKLLPRPVAGLPAVRVHGQGGLLDVTTHPQFASNGLIYWSFANGDDANVGTEVARGKLAGDAAAGYRLDQVEVIFRQQPKNTGSPHFGSRLVWDRAGNLFVTLGDRGQMQEAQNLSGHLGKIVRISEAGRIPADNPFATRPNARPEIFSLGNRNVQGAAPAPGAAAPAPRSRRRHGTSTRYPGRSAAAPRNRGACSGGTMAASGPGCPPPAPAMRRAVRQESRGGP